MKSVSLQSPSEETGEKIPSLKPPMARQPPAEAQGEAASWHGPHWPASWAYQAAWRREERQPAQQGDSEGPRRPSQGCCIWVAGHIHPKLRRRSGQKTQSGRSHQPESGTGKQGCYWGSQEKTSGRWGEQENALTHRRRKRRLLQGKAPCGMLGEGKSRAAITPRHNSRGLGGDLRQRSFPDPKRENLICTQLSER